MNLPDPDQRRGKMLSWKIGVLSASLGKANLTPFQHLVQVAEELSIETTVIEVRTEDAMASSFYPVGRDHLLLTHAH